VFGTLEFAEWAGCWRAKWDGEVGASWVQHSSLVSECIRVREFSVSSYLFLLRW
jgi:hypothetical protein